MAAELVAGLRGGAAEREAAYTELFRLEAEHEAAGSAGLAGVAVACAVPLCEVMCKAVAQVSAAEYRRAAQVLTALSGVSPTLVGAECIKPTSKPNLFDVWAAPESALGVVLAKAPAELTLDDALTATSSQAPMIVHWSTSIGCDGPAQAAGMTADDVFAAGMPFWFMMPVAHESDDRNTVLVPLLLELLRKPESLPEFALAGILWSLGQGFVGRPAIAALAVQPEHDAIGVMMSIVRQTTPRDLISTAGYARRGAPIQVLANMKELCEAAQVGGLDLTPQLLSSGYIDALVGCYTAVEQVGEVSNCTGHQLHWGLELMKELEGEALGEIEDKFRAAKSALRFIIDHEVCHSAHQGRTTGAVGTILAAQLYGKDEDNSFGFKQADIDKCKCNTLRRVFFRSLKGSAGQTWS